MARDILTDEQWERLRPLLPPQKPRTGRPSKKGHRTVLNAILWIDRTGAPSLLSTVPGRAWPPASTGGSRRGCASVYWRSSSAKRTPTEGELELGLHHVDGTVVRAHQRAELRSTQPADSGSALC